MTKIEWTHVPDGKGGRKKGETINPQVGCREVSPGCRNCYAARLAARGMTAQHRGLTVLTSNGPHWNGEINRVPEQLEKVLRWREPRGIFWGSMTDMFIESNMETEQARRFVAACFGAMAATPQHTHMVLTKRPAIMRRWFEWAATEAAHYGTWRDVIIDPLRDPERPRLYIAAAEFDGHAEDTRQMEPAWPLPNVWIGTTVEDQQRADERIPDLLATPAAVRFLSVEPMLGPVDLSKPMPANWPAKPGRGAWDWASPLTGCGWDAQSGEWGAGSDHRSISWVICGGESGPGARPMHPAWVRSLRDQCFAAGVPFFLKQWGAWATDGEIAQRWSSGGPTLSMFESSDQILWTTTVESTDRRKIGERTPNWLDGDRGRPFYMVGKGKSGRELDGRTWDEFPEDA